jgi:hypothetical protein
VRSWTPRPRPQSRPRATSRALERFEERIGRKLDLHRLFLRWDDPATGAAADVARGRTPILSIQPARRNGTRLTWAAVASGRHDADIVRQARAIAALDAPVFLTFNHEPDFSPGFGTPGEYVAAWRHYVGVFRAEGVRNVAWTWTMAPSSFRRPPVGAGADAYYPGDDVVDWLALDAYNWYGCGPGKPTAWRSLAEVVSPFRTWSLPHGKPLMLAEWGSSEDPADPQRKANWLRDAMTTLAGWPEFKAASYFHTFGNCAWWVDSSAPSERAFVEIAAGATAHGRPTASLAVSAEHGAAPLRVTFDGSASAGAGARSGQGVGSWRLDFGDGSAPRSGRGTPPRGLAHTFAVGTHAVRLTVSDGAGASATDTRTVTAAGPPTVAANATDATATTVLLHAWVKPHGLAATVTFQWGTTSSYGQRSARLSVPAQDWAAHLQLPLTGLAPGTRYYWRVVATSQAGTTVLGGRHVDTTESSAVSSGATRTQSTSASAHSYSIDTNAWFGSGTGWAGTKRN